MIEITPIVFNLELVKNYLRVDHDFDDIEIQLYMQSAISYVVNYTKSDVETIIANKELFIPILNLINYFYEYKTTLIPTSTKISAIFNNILDMHREDIV